MKTKIQILLSLFVFLFSAAAFAQSTCARSHLGNSKANKTIDRLLEGEFSRFEKLDPVKDHNPFLVTLMREQVAKLYELQSKFKNEISAEQQETALKAIQRFEKMVELYTSHQRMTFEKFQILSEITPALITLNTNEANIQKYYDSIEPAKQKDHELKGALADLNFARDIAKELIMGLPLKDIVQWQGAFKNNVDYYRNKLYIIPTFEPAAFYDFLTWGSRYSVNGLSGTPLTSFDGAALHTAIGFKHHDGSHDIFFHGASRPTASSRDKKIFIGTKIMSVDKSEIQMRMDYLAQFFRAARSKLTAEEQTMAGSYFFYILHEYRAETLLYVASFMSEKIAFTRDAVIEHIHRRAQDSHDFKGDFPNLPELPQFAEKMNASIDKVMALYKSYVQKNPPPFDPLIDSAIRQSEAQN